MDLYNQISEHILGWDGVHMDHLLEIHESFHSKAKFYGTLISMCHNDEELQIGASWLIKHLYDEKGHLSENQIDHLIDSVSVLKAWAARLHVLQIIPLFEMNENRANRLEDFVRVALKDDKKFVKAAAYEAFYHVAQSRRALLPELKLICDHAMETESASIKSKVRKILKALDKS